LGGSEFRMLGGPRTLAPTSHSPTLFRAMRTGEPYPIEAFLIFGNNALLTYANPREVYDSLMKVGFFAVMDIYMTPTAELADIVLPAATWLEGDQIFPLPYVAANVVVAQQKVVSMWEARQTEEVLSELARRLNLESGTEPPQEILDYQLAPLGITFEELKEKGWVTVPLAYRKYEANGFATPSGKVELSASTLANEGYDPLPYYQEPPESPFSQPELAQEYPFILITGGRTQQYFLSEYRQVPSLRQAHPDPLVEINPQTAGQFQIEDGDWVWIESPRGRIKQKARLTEDIDPRVVHVQHGWWFPEETDPEHGVWRSNANLLTSNGPPYDPALGTYQLRALLCKIYKSERPNPDT